MTHALAVRTSRDFLTLAASPLATTSAATERRVVIVENEGVVGVLEIRLRLLLHCGDG